MLFRWLIIVCFTNLYTALCPEICKCKKTRFTYLVICDTENMAELRILDIYDVISLHLIINKMKNIEEPIFLPSNRIKKLKIEARKLTVLNSSTFKNLRLLEDLTVCGTQVAKLNISSTLVNLISLSIEYNFKLKYIENKTDSKKLEFLNLKGNPSLFVHMDFLNQFTYLKSLSIDQVQTLNLQNESFSSFRRLQTVNLKNIGLRDIEMELFLGLDRAERLDLSRNDIDSIANGSFDNLRSLKYLSLRKNRITHLPRNLFRYQNNLTFLYLDSNNISTVNDDLFRNLTNLQGLLLHFNSLTNIHPNSFSSQSSLRKLSLCSNMLKTIPKGLFSSLTNLSMLLLHNNQINIIEEETFSGLSALKFLNINNNKISYMHHRGFQYLKHLQFLDLDGNQLSFLPKYLFSNLSALFSLKLARNNLSLIRKSAFENMSTLSVLKLSENSLVKLERDAFKNCISLTVLNIRHNNLTTLNKDLFPSKKISTIYMKYNKIKCTCYLLKLLEHISYRHWANCDRNGSVMDTNKMTCIVIRKHWRKFTLKQIAPMKKKYATNKKNDVLFIAEEFIFQFKIASKSFIGTLFWLMKVDDGRENQTVTREILRLKRYGESLVCLYRDNGTERSWFNVSIPMNSTKWNSVKLMYEREMTFYRITLIVNDWIKSRMTSRRFGSTKYHIQLMTLFQSGSYVRGRKIFINGRFLDRSSSSTVTVYSYATILVSSILSYLLEVINEQF